MLALGVLIHLQSNCKKYYHPRTDVFQEGLSFYNFGPHLGINQPKPALRECSTASIIYAVCFKQRFCDRILACKQSPVAAIFVIILFLILFNFVLPVRYFVKRAFEFLVRNYL